MANRVFSVIRKLFGWAVDRDVLQASPCVGVEAPVTEFRRDRVLSDNELRAFWKACDEMGYPFGPLFQLLLLTGTRLREVSEMTQGELNLADRLWTIPRERAKNNQVHIVPLSDAAMEIIEALPQIVSKPGYLFTTTGTRLSSFSRAKMMLDQRMRKIAPEVEVTEWHLHDLRRTCATGLQRLGIRFEVTEAVLNHLSGSKGGVAGIYQRHDWKAEKAAALQAWGRFVMALVSDQPATNVAVLRPVA